VEANCRRVRKGGGEVICDTRGASWKKERERIAIWQEQGLTRQQRTREEGRRLRNWRTKTECNNGHHIRHNTPTHVYWTHKRRKKEKTSQGGKEREKVVNGEWVKMANGMEVVKGGYRVHGTGSGV